MSTPNDFAFKYQHVNPFTKLHVGEPWFFVRAQDELGTETVQAYADLLKRESDRARNKGNQELADQLLKQALGVLKVANAFADWQLDNKDKVKLPD